MAAYTSPEQLLRRAQAELDEVGVGTGARSVFLHAHMAGLRAAAAVVAVGTGAVPVPARRRRAVRSVWEQLAEAGEQWQPWAVYFASGAPIRAAIDSDRDVALSVERAQETFEAATEFLGLAGEHVLRASAARDLRVSALAS
ncbi:SAV_6107 family HEPN domain-containing protein [Occultella gossypii]|uniref:Colicin transporter n=1 Tax=Occultella gossypii TaxID=2800820 RepID=A0ABS7SIY0_9MICO|nr:SAV_6107 family HEPN domain-containing protein [Occultella gossypii]MBZ2199238.1 colicin transporter [Occultella gossypii]